MGAVSGMSYILVAFFIIDWPFKGVTLMKFATAKACESVVMQIKSEISNAKCIEVDESIRQQEIKHDTIGIGK